jgi:hypothetical protein
MMSRIEYASAENALGVPSVPAGKEEGDAVCSRWVAKVPTPMETATFHPVVIGDIQ